MKWLKTREREPRRPLSFGRPQSAQVYGIAWFRAEDWPRLREISADGATLEWTHAEWEATATRRIGEMAELGIALQKVDVDVDRLAAWCAGRGQTVNADTRALFVEWLLREAVAPSTPPALAPAVAAQPMRAASPASGAAPPPGAPLAPLDRYFAERVDLLHAVRGTMTGAIQNAARVFVETIRAGGTIYFFGNGGSAADAQHLSTELVERLLFDRPGFRAHALTTNTSLLTATANDRGYDDAFARQVETFARPGDLLVAISTSGKSPSVLRALEAGRRLRVRTLGLTGKGGGDMPALCDLCLVVPSDDTQKIQEMHIAIGHYLCMTVEAELGR